MSDRLACPNCASDTAVLGHHERGVYDGILYWGCMECGHLWHRWPEGHGLHARAEAAMVALLQHGPPA